MSDEEQKKQSIFRQQALEYITSIQSADDLIPATTSFAWLTLLALGIFLLALIFWLFLGVVQLHVQGRGLLLTENLAIVYVPAVETPPLHTGMVAWLSPIRNGKLHTPHFSGKIVNVDNIPVTPNEMLNQLKNPSLVSYFLQTGPQLALYIQLNKSVYDSLDKGSLIEARIVIQQESPFAMMLSGSK